MTKLIAMAAPILKGKTEQWKKFSDELNGRYKKEFNDSRKNLGVQERTFLQTTPDMGDIVLITLEGENPETAFKQFSQGKDEFTKWFNTQVKEIHGLDLNQIAALPVPKLVAQTEPIKEHALH